ncbi:uncharacterized protein TNCV_4222691 [Trichonephila clavipes]|nr:uncharacterized protein TNCV_4222691 [Trichonephila clavipes]
MSLAAPKQRVLPLWMLREESERKVIPETVWEIDVPSEKSIQWAFILCYLTTEVKKRSLHHSLTNLFNYNKQFKFSLKNKVQFSVPKLEKLIKKFNPYKNYNYIYWNRLFRRMHRLLELNLQFAASEMSDSSGCDLNNVVLLQTAAKILQCVIHVFKTDVSGNNYLCSFSPEEDLDNLPRLILFVRLDVADNMPAEAAIDKGIFSFGISSEYVIPLRHAALVHILKRANLSEVEIKQVLETVQNKDKFLSCLLRSSNLQIIFKLYKSRYIIRKLSEAGFETDPRSTDEFGLSSFYHCMNLPDSNVLRVLYYFSTNSIMVIDKTVSNTRDIMNALDKTAEALSKRLPCFLEFQVSGEG